MNPSCARCGKIVYAAERLSCLDKFWHRGCFRCEVCRMTLSMNNYKGFDKKPYCSAHYPKQTFTLVTDTPESLRLKQQTELQSQVRYRRDFEESKRQGFRFLLDSAELQRLRRTQEHISNVGYQQVLGSRGVADGLPVPPSVHQKQTVPLGSQHKAHRFIVERRAGPGVIVAPVLPGALQTLSHSYSMSSLRSHRHTSVYRAMYDYVGQDVDEVSFRDGDIIHGVQPIGSGWVYGTVQRTGRSGMLPGNYIQGLQ